MIVFKSSIFCFALTIDCIVMFALDHCSVAIFIVPTIMALLKENCLLHWLISYRPSDSVIENQKLCDILSLKSNRSNRKSPSAPRNENCTSYSLFKSGDKSLFTNYRPVSVLPVFSKFLERIVYNRLINFLNKYDILSRNQYGFRKIILLHML